MSRDGYLPPGCTEADVDRACPGYYDDPTEPPVWEEPLCCICGKQIESPDKPEALDNEPCHATCLEDYRFSCRYDGPEYEPKE